MELPESLSQGAKWALLVGLAFFSADATAALIQEKLKVPPKPMPQASSVTISENAPAQAAPPGLISLLKKTGPQDPNGPSVKALPSAKGPKRINPKAPKKAPSNFKLRGTMANSQGGGLAMIDFNGATQVVGQGEAIGELVLVSVGPYSVRLEGNDQIQLLEMDSILNAGAASSSLPTPRQVRKTTTTAKSTNPSPSPSPEGDAGAILTQRELRNILDNPASFAGKGFRTKPVLKGGDIVGMRVTIANSSHPLARLGIKSGDVVKSLNNTPLNGPESLSKIVRILRNTSSLSFDVERNGTAQKVELTLEE